MSYSYQIGSLEQYHHDYKKSVEDPDGFWSAIAENFQWKKKWDKVLEWNFTEPKATPTRPQAAPAPKPAPGATGPLKLQVARRRAA